MEFGEESLGGETTDVVEGGSSDASEGQDNGGTAPAAAAPKQEDTTDWAKVFEHPRFKELNSERNQFKAESQEFQRKLAELESKFVQSREPQGPSKEQTEAQALIEDLKKVDPRLAAQVEASMKAQANMQSMQSRLEQFEKQSAAEKQQATIQAAVGKINQLHDSNKVSPEIKQIINLQLDLMWRDGKLSPQNLEGEYTKALGDYNKMVDGIKRAERESYVAAKKKDGAVPTSQPKGEPAKSAPKKQQWSTDPEIRNAQIVSRYMKQTAANKEAGST